MSNLRASFLYQGNAEEAMNFYRSVFKDFEELGVVRMPGEGSVGSVLTVNFRIKGVEFVGINGGPDVTFNDSVSFIIDCEDQAEVDYYWEALIADGGEESMCGWLKDKFGLSWQVTPRQMTALLGDPDPDRSGRAMQAMLKMRKLDIATLEAAANGS